MFFFFSFPEFPTKHASVLFCVLKVCGEVFDRFVMLSVAISLLWLFTFVCDNERA